MDSKQTTPTLLTKLFCLQILLAICRLGKAVSSKDGYMTPNGDIKLKEGEDLDINCTLYQSSQLFQKYGQNSSLYMTFKVRENDSLTTLNTSILNNGTTIGLQIKNLKPVFRALYQCEFIDDTNNTVLDYSCVTVAPPPKVTDLKCQFFDLTEVTCTWTDKNYFKTDYQLNYSSSNDLINPNTKAQGHLSNIFWSESKDCTKECRQANNIYTCTWNSTDQCYSDLSTYHKYTLIMKDEKNQTNSSTSVYNQWENVTPNSPNLSIEANQATAHSIELSIGLKEAIKYKSVLNNPQKWINYAVDIQVKDQKYLKYKKSFRIPLEATTIKYKIVGLRYANTNYSIRAAIINKKNIANGISSVTKIQGITKPKRPDRPPKTTLGSFQTVSTSVKVYWQEINETEKNGDNFSYYIEEEKNPNLNKTSHTCFAVFENLTADRNFTFKIWSQNELGRSENHSEISVPAQKYRRKNTQKLSLLDDGKKDYLFLWDPPPHSIIRNYTVFWCKVKIGGKANSAPICQGKLNWEIKSNTSTNITISRNTTEENLQFAIAANYYDGTSGMSWTQNYCIFPPFESKDLEIDITALPENLTIHWRFNLDNCAGVAPTFYISYCSQENKICDNKSTNDTHYTFNELNADLTYNVNISMNSTIFDYNVEAFGFKTGIKINTEKAQLRYMLFLIIPALVVLGNLGYKLRKKYLKLRENQPDPAFPPTMQSVIDSKTETDSNTLSNNDNITLLSENAEKPSKDKKVSQPLSGYNSVGLYEQITKDSSQTIKNPVTIGNDEALASRGILSVLAKENKKENYEKPVTKEYIDVFNLRSTSTVLINKNKKENSGSSKTVKKNILKGYVDTLDPKPIPPVLIDKNEKSISSEKHQKPPIKGYVDHITKNEKHEPISFENANKLIIKGYREPVLTNKNEIENPKNNFDQLQKPATKGYVDTLKFRGTPAISNNKNKEEKDTRLENKKNHSTKECFNNNLHLTDTLLLKYTNPLTKKGYSNNIFNNRKTQSAEVEELMPKKAIHRNVQLKQSADSHHVTQLRSLPNIPLENAMQDDYNGDVTMQNNHCSKKNSKSSLNFNKGGESTQKILDYYLVSNNNGQDQENIKIKKNASFLYSAQAISKKEPHSHYSLVVPLNRFSDNSFINNENNNLKPTEDCNDDDVYLLVEYQIPDTKESTGYLDMANKNSTPDEYVHMEPPYKNIS